MSSRAREPEGRETVEYRIVDCDQHVIEPPELWEKYLPKKFHARAPRLVRDEDGGDAWQLGSHVESLGLVAAKEVSPRNLRWTGTRYEDMHPGIYEAKGRLELLDEDGIHACVLFPPQRTMIYFMTCGDEELQLAGMQAYNEFISEFCANDPRRLGAIWQMPGTRTEDAVAMLREARKAGAVGVGLASWPSGEALISEADEPFWAAAEELEMPVHVHIGLVPAKQATQKVAARKGGPPQLVLLASTMSRMPVLIADMIFNKVFCRHPGLIMVGGEVGAGWVPYLLQEMDDRYKRNRFWCEVDLEGRLPSEYYASNWKVGFIQDQYGVQNCDAVGVDTMMWCSDFPHHGNDFPHSKLVINEMSHGIEAWKKARIFGDNAAELYGFTD